MANLTGPKATVDLNGWYISNNMWNPYGSGRGYTISGTYDPRNLTEGLRYTWSFGPVPAGGNYNAVYAFPELGFGQDPWSKTILPEEKPFPLSLASLSKFKVTYDVGFGGQTQAYNVALEMYLTSKPGGGAGTITDEIMVWIHNAEWHPAGSPVGSFSDQNYSGKIYSYPVYQEGLHFRYTAVLTNADDPRGAIDIKAIMQKLKAMRIIDGTEYIANIQLGAEIAAGKGWFAVNDFQLNIQKQGARETIIDGGGPRQASRTGSTRSAATQDARSLAAAESQPDIMWTDAQARFWKANAADALSGGGTSVEQAPVWNMAPPAGLSSEGTRDILRQAGSGQPMAWTMNGLSPANLTALRGEPGASWHAAG